MNEPLSYLQLPITPEQRREWARELSAPPAGEATSETRKFFVAQFGAEWFGLPPALVSAVLPDARPAPLPHRVGTLIEGLVNADGRVIVCLDLARLFGAMPAQDEPESPQLLIFSADHWLFAARARRVLGMCAIDTALLQPPPGGSEILRHCAQGSILQDGRAITCLEGKSLARQLAEAIR